MTIEQFWAKLDKSAGDDACWLWPCTSASGYASIYTRQGTFRAHRLAAQMAGMKIDGLLVCHRCDVRNCCNPKHLFIGTDTDNMRDMVAKGRGNNQKKTHCPRGHEYTPENTMISIRLDGKRCRQCRMCRRKIQRSNEEMRSIARTMSKAELEKARVGR